MLIAIIGTPSAGKHTVVDYLVQRHGFKHIGLKVPSEFKGSVLTELDTGVQNLPNLTISSTSLMNTAPIPPVFENINTMLDYTTRNWLEHHVTLDLRTYEEIEPFVKRPWFLLVFVDGPLRIRFERERERGRENLSSSSTLTLDSFIDTHDLLNGPSLPSHLPAKVLSHLQTDFQRVTRLAQVHVYNNFPTVDAFWTYLDQLDLLDQERLRPGWDTYFMTLASLASHRSNCMKRRVGALLVRSKRILSTGYNGTPRGTKNCNQGGCRRCNGSARGGEALDECLCLHAEENALLEAGRDRIGSDAVLYCNTCPCLRCSVKIVQCGVREVVYNQSYSMDEASAMVLQEGGVLLRQWHMPL
ncbi:dCMP deaminase [Tremella mesenterica]|uniref:Deoxycytidylate deaminase n=1 Tax=Tremella mesenterica TaxID=5217 RepID=A0A4Q1BJF9_TREME|nr:dCMP deaminase [Tremella mesenterica]